MFFELPLFWFFVYFMIILLLSFWLGTLLAKSRKGNKNSTTDYSFFIEGTLLSMLLGFTFAQAAGKFEKRRESVKNEVNNISVVIYRSELYPDSISKLLQQDIKSYINSREDYFNALSDEVKAQESLKRSTDISKKLFSKVAFFAKNPSNQLFTMQMVPALNNMIEVAKEIEIYRKSFIPVAILRLLFLVCVLMIFTFGFNQANDRNGWIKSIGFSLLVSMTFVLILDLQDFSRGSISLENKVQYITDLKELFN